MSALSVRYVQLQEVNAVKQIICVGRHICFYKFPQACLHCKSNTGFYWYVALKQTVMLSMMPQMPTNIPLAKFSDMRLFVVSD